MASRYSIEGIFSLIDKVTKPLNQIEKKSNAVSRRIQRDFVAAQRRVDNLGKAIGKWSKRAALAATAAATAWVGIGVRNAIKLADTMAIIGSNANITGPPLERLQSRLTDVANQAGVAVNELAGIANTAIGLGVASNAAADFAGVVAKTSRVTGAANDTVVAGITNVLAAYGKSADEGNRIAGIMVSANRLGRTSFRELTYSMRYAIPTAASFGVQAEEVFAAVTALTAGGETTRESMQAMGKALNAIRTPSANAAALAQHLGINFSEAALQSKGFAGVMDEVRRKTGGDMRAMEMLFGNERTARAMSLLASSGATAFNEALAEMSKATETVSTEFARVTDTPAQRWQKAINRIQNSGVRLGTALLPLAERIIAKFSDMADRLAGVDFSRFTAEVNLVFGAVERLGGKIARVIGFAWRFRNVIIAVVGTIGLYHGALMGLAVATSVLTRVKAALRAITAVVTGAKMAYAIVIRKNVDAQTALTSATKETGIATKIWSAIMTKTMKIKKAFAGLTTKQKVALVLKTAVLGRWKLAQRAATKAQLLLNAALKANPIGFVIGLAAILVKLVKLLARNWNRLTEAIRNNTSKVFGLITVFAGPFGIVISMVKELLTNWHRVIDAFQDGGILGAIRQIAKTLLSGILAPIQGLLELVSNLPGLGHLAGIGADKIAGLRNSLLGEGSDITANTRQNRRREALAATMAPRVDYDLSAYERALNAIEMPSLEFPEVDIPDFTMPDLTRQNIRGVVDISGGASATNIPNFSRGSTPGTFTQNLPAAPAVSVQEAIRTAAYKINNTLSNILAATRAINTTASPIPQQVEIVTATTTNGIDNTLKEILAVNTAIKTTTLALAALPQQAINTGRTERECAENDNPRNIPPVTREERITHAIQEHRETLSIEVAAAQGTQARIVRTPKSPNIQLVHSGGNA